MGGKIEMGCKVIGCAYDETSETWTVRYTGSTGDIADARSRARDLLRADARTGARTYRPRVRASDETRRRELEVSRLPHRHADPEGPTHVRRQLDLHPRSEREGRPHPELPVVVARDGAGPDKACYGLEYFCFEHDGLWDSSDADLIELAKRELIQIGLAQEGDVVDGCVVRQKKAYPVYDDDYARARRDDPRRAGRRYPNLHLVGRNGMHKYNNQDHAMMTAMLCVENILADTKLYDLWQVNSDAEYHEAGAAAAEERAAQLFASCADACRAAPELASERLVLCSGSL